VPSKISVNNSLNLTVVVKEEHSIFKTVYLRINRDRTRYNKLPFIPESISAYKNKLFKIRFICSQIVLGVDGMSFSGPVCCKRFENISA